MKKLFIFLAGFVAGVIAVNLYELFGVPAMPSPEDDYPHEWTEADITRINKGLKVTTTEEFRRASDRLGKLLASLDETQPIYIGEPEQEVTAYELYIWSGESE